MFSCVQSTYSWNCCLLACHKTKKTWADTKTKFYWWCKQLSSTLWPLSTGVALPQQLQPSVIWTVNFLTVTQCKQRLYFLTSWLTLGFSYIINCFHINQNPLIHGLVIQCWFYNIRWYQLCALERHSLNNLESTSYLIWWLKGPSEGNTLENKCGASLLWVSVRNKLPLQERSEFTLALSERDESKDWMIL